jgi:hypothetical protein
MRLRASRRESKGDGDAPKAPSAPGSAKVTESRPLSPEVA